MATDDKKSELLRTLNSLDPERITQEDFLKAYEEVLKKIAALQKANETEWTLIHSSLQMLESKLRDANAESFAGLVGENNTRMDGHAKTIAEKLKAIDERIATVRDGIDGKDADEEKIVQDVLAQIQLPEQKETILDTPEEIRNKLEVLNGDERLKASAISGLDEITKDVQEIKSRPRIAGARGIVLYVNGVKKLLGAQTLNITGSGVSYNFANGRNDITITGSGGALAVLTATGTINDSNVTFTFASEPTLVVVNGATYRDGAGCTISGTTVTLNNPVGTGGDVYALG